MYGQNIVQETLRQRESSLRFGSEITNISGTYLEGLDELVKQFMSLGEDMAEKLGPVSTRCAEIVAARARRKVHSIDQDLVNGIVVQKPGDNNKYVYSHNYTHRRYTVFAKVKLDAGAYHGVPVELGHKMSGYFGTKAGSNFERVPEHPFLRPAADESKTEVANILANAMNDIIKEYSP